MSSQVDTDALAKALKEAIGRLPHFNVGKGYFAHVRVGEVFQVIDSLLPPSKPSSQTQAENGNL